MECPLTFRDGTSHERWNRYSDSHRNIVSDRNCNFNRYSYRNSNCYGNRNSNPFWNSSGYGDANPGRRWNSGHDQHFD